MRVSSSDSPRSLEFRSCSRQPGHYTGFWVTSRWAVILPLSRYWLCTLMTGRELHLSEVNGKGRSLLHEIPAQISCRPRACSCCLLEKNTGGRENYIPSCENEAELLNFNRVSLLATTLARQGVFLHLRLRNDLRKSFRKGRVQRSVDGTRIECVDASFPRKTHLDNWNRLIKSQPTARRPMTSCADFDLTALFYLYRLKRPKHLYTKNGLLIGGNVIEWRPALGGDYKANMAEVDLN